MSSIDGGTTKSSGAGYLSKNEEDNRKRNLEMMNNMNEIERLERRLAALREQNEDRLTTWSLRYHGSAEKWRALPSNKKWKKENVLAILECTENSSRLPNILKESNFLGWMGKAIDKKDNVPRSTQEDNDIFLARIRRNDFLEYHTKRSTNNLFVQHGFRKAISDSSIVCLQEILPEAIYENLVSCWETFLRHADPGTIYRELKKPITYKTWNHPQFEHRLKIQAAGRNTRVLKLCSNDFTDTRKYALRIADMHAASTTEHVWEDDCLKYFSRKVRASKMVALKFVRLHGASYEHVAYGVRKGDERLARIACRSYPTALLRSVPPEIERKLTCKKTFMLKIFKICRKDKLALPAMWKILSPNLKRDQQLAVEALASHCMDAIDVSKLPSAWKEDRTFWLRVVKRNPSTWLAPDLIPAVFRSDYEFAKDIPEVWPIIDDILEEFPFLTDDRDFLRNLLSSRLDYSNNAINLPEKLPGWAFADKELMLLAVKHDVCVVKQLREPLDVDRDIFQTAVEKGGADALRHVSVEAMQLYPVVVTEALRRSEQFLDIEQLWDKMEELTGTIWEDREFLSAWFEAGGYWHEDIPDRVRTDRELLLLTAKHNHETEMFEAFATDEMLWDKSYMLRVLEQSKGKCLALLDAPLADDFDIMLVACASAEQPLGRCHHSNKAFMDFSVRVRNRLKTQDIFLKLVLCGMSVASVDCPLRSLDQGRETLLDFKKTLAEFLDVPNGKELRFLRRASANLASWGF